MQHSRCKYPYLERIAAAQPFGQIEYGPINATVARGTSSPGLFSHSICVSLKQELRFDTWVAEGIDKASAKAPRWLGNIKAVFTCNLICTIRLQDIRVTSLQSEDSACDVMTWLLELISDSVRLQHASGNPSGNTYPTTAEAPV